MKLYSIFFSLLIIHSSLLGIAHTPFQAGSFSMQGKRPTMEDRDVIAWSFDGMDDHHFFGVYDGHGGNKAADFAAQNLHHELKACATNNTHLQIQHAVAITEKRLLKKANLEHFNDGTCALFAIIKGKTLTIGNIGDSRAVLCRNGCSVALSSDQKPDRPDEKQRIQNAGGHIIKMGPWRTPGGLAVSRALGDARLKKHNYVIATPEITTTTLQNNDEFLILACDGVWDVLSNETAVDVVQKSLSLHYDPTRAAKALAEHAYANGSTDNISVLVVCLQDKRES